MDDRIALSDALYALRLELIDAMRASSTAELKFGVSGVEMEFVVQTTRTGEGSAGIRFWVIDAQAKGSVTSGSTQRLTLSLVPVTADGGEVKVTSFVTGEIG